MCGPDDIESKLKSEKELQEELKTTKNDKFHLYVLKCEEGKYYVGKSYDFTTRYKKHLAGDGAFWTKRYKPIGLAELLSNVDKYDEDKYVWKYMEKYGIDNVRGGSYSQMILSPELRKCAERHINSGANLCYACSGYGHLIRECPKKRKREEDINEDELDNVNPDKKLKISKDGYVLLKCSRCGKYGHFIDQCFSKKNADGSDL
jgi:hypothetical protein